MTTASKVDFSDHGVSFNEALRVWVKIALLSFGGPAAQIAVMHRILVEEKKWISESRFLHALNYCMLLPGPEAQQLCIYIGWLLHRTVGGIVAGSLFVLPGFIAILGLSYLYVIFQNADFMQGIFYGLKPAVMVVVLEAVLRIGKKALKNNLMKTVAICAFVALFFFQVPFPLLITGVGILGYIGGRYREDLFFVIRPHETDNEQNYVITSSMAAHTRPTFFRFIRVSVIFGILWGGVLLVLKFLPEDQSIFFQVGYFFSKAACVTFGGAYSVLSYIAQQAVEHYKWLNAAEMLDGLGMAETTPGPLIQVVQFVGFMAAYRNPGNLSPGMAGFLGAIVTVWVTYVPCFFWIFLGAPYIEHLRQHKLLSSALSTITAAVVGVILNLAIWFSLHTLFGTLDSVSFYTVRFLVPDFRTLDLISLALFFVSALALLRYKWNMLLVFLAAGILGVGLKILS